VAATDSIKSVADGIKSTTDGIESLANGIGSASDSISSSIRRFRKEIVAEMQRQGKRFRRPWWRRIFPSPEKYGLPFEKSIISPTSINVVSPLLGRHHRRVVPMPILNLYIGCVECLHLVITISIDFRTNGSGEGDRGVITFSEHVEVITVRDRSYNMSDYWSICWDDPWVVISYRSI